jgi:hypothetical protein
MKLDRTLKFLCALLGLMLFHSVSNAQTIDTASYTNFFETGGNTTDFTGGSVASWLYWYGLSFGNTAMTNDPTMNVDNDTNVNGSLYCSLPFTGINEQVQIFGTFDNEYGYDNSEQIPLDLITNIAFDIHVQPGTIPDSSGNFGQIVMSVVDPGWNDGGRVGTWTAITIPGTASNGWVHLQDANLSNDLATMELSESGLSTVYTNAAGVGFYVQSYGGYPTNTFTFWIDNVAVTTSSAPPPPPPPPTLSISPVVQGLNLFTGSGTGLNNRENLETVVSNYSWVGASGPVSYSFTISDYPVGPDDAVQCQIFLIPNPSSTTDTAPDYVETNAIFLDLESDVPNGGGAQWNFRYKTNEPQGNTMVYGSGTLASIATNTAIGTWTVTFNNNTNVTMTVPGGASTNFNIPDSTGATSALFASNVVLYFGVQANNAGATKDHIVASDFNVTGLGSADFNDNFVTDAGTLNTALWLVDASFPKCVQLLGPGNPYWVQWTTPATAFSLVTSPSLSPADWLPAASNPTFLAGTTEAQLISTNDLPEGDNAYFSVVQRAYSQLLILLPGETNAPNTPTGKSGTPTPVSLGSDSGILVVTVQAVDAHFYPVNTGSDTIAITDSSGGTATDPAPAAMVNGVVQFNGNLPAGPQPVVFSTTGTFTVTATDTSNTNILPATSSSVTVGP